MQRLACMCARPFLGSGGWRPPFPPKNGPHNLLLKQVVMGRGREGRFRGPFRRSHSIRLKPNTMGMVKWLSLAGGGGHRRRGTSSRAAGVISGGHGPQCSGGGIRPRPRPPERRRRGTTPRIFPRPQGGRHARARTARRGVFSARRAKIGGFEVWVSVVFARILGGGGWAFWKSRRNGPEGGGVRKERGTVAAHLIIYICARVYARVGVRTRERGMYEKKSVLCLAVTNFIRTFAA